jgi:hypothetical protein
MHNPIVAIVKNTTKGTFHPIVFVESPLPGPPSADKPVRHKSSMHHTTGFATREEALADIDSVLIPRIKTVAAEPRKALTRDFEWDGNGVPSIVEFFTSDMIPAIESSNLKMEIK